MTPLRQGDSPPRTPFDTFGIPAEFDVDPVALEQRYRDLSRAVHPDRFTGVGAKERRMALSKAVDVNAAWRVLRDPIARAEALLSARGVPDATTTEKASPELLMRMMELREDLAGARSSRDRGKIEALAGTVRDREASVLKALSAGFQSPAEDSSRQKALVSELRYLRRFLDEVRAIEEEME